MSNQKKSNRPAAEKKPSSMAEKKPSSSNRPKRANTNRTQKNTVHAKNRRTAVDSSASAVLPSKKKLLLLFKQSHLPVRHLLKKFSGCKRKDLLQIADQLASEGKLVRAGNEYAAPELLFEGVLQITDKGFGFCACPNRTEDVFMPPSQLRGLLTGDRIQGVLQKDTRKKSGISGCFLRLLDRKIKTVVGHVVHTDEQYFIWGRGRLQNVRLPLEPYEGIAPDQLIEAKLPAPSKELKKIMATKVKILPENLTLNDEVAAILSEFQVISEWPDKLLKEIPALEKNHPHIVSQSQRVDLTDVEFMTIDGDDAKDFDDAVFCERKGKHQWRLMVAIADVSAYVKPGSVLDEAALDRGTSIYIPNRVIPMLPDVLSENLCSLRPNEKRAAMVCEICWNEKQNTIESYDFYEATIISKCRFTYRKFDDFLNNGTIDPAFKWAVPRLENLFEMYQKLRFFRRKRGVFDIRPTEVKIDIAGQDDVQVSRVKSLVSNEVIEECMLLANVCAALMISRVAGIYRIHDKPSEQSINQLIQTIDTLGGESNQFDHLRDFQTLIDHFKAHQLSDMVQLAVLQSMQKAVYSPSNIGHFALGYKHYTHFTSPIRRFSDLIVHRIIKAVNAKKPEPYKKSTLHEMALQCSVTERLANQISWEVQAFYQCVSAKQHEGKSIEAVVSGSNSKFLFLQSETPFVEGALSMELLGKQHNYSIGKKIMVTISKIDWNKRRVIFKPN